MRDAAGVERLIAAVDSRGGVVVIHGWRTKLSLTAAEAARLLEPLPASSSTPTSTAKG